jgi:hypothetical protein
MGSSRGKLRESKKPLSEQYYIEMENYKGNGTKNEKDKHYSDYTVIYRPTKDQALIYATLGLGMDYNFVTVKTPKGKVIWRK